MTRRDERNSWGLGARNAAVAALFFGAVAFAAQQTVGGGADWTTIPPPLKQTETALKGAKLTLAQAMAKAEAAAGGPSLQARAQVDGADVIYEFVCSANGLPKRVSVNGTTGDVSAPVLTLSAAIDAALAKAPGVVSAAEGDLLAEPPSYRVHIVGDGVVHQILINASSGVVIEDVQKGRFPGIFVAADPVATPSGLQYIDIVEGTGPTPSTPTSMVKVHYTGYLVNGDKFDSSVDRGAPIDFGLDKVVKGWSEGVGSMKVGGKRKLIIPYALAYGEAGRGPIPPKATLIFDVELLGVDGD